MYEIELAALEEEYLTHSNYEQDASDDEEWLQRFSDCTLEDIEFQNECERLYSQYIKPNS